MLRKTMTVVLTIVLFAPALFADQADQVFAAQKTKNEKEITRLLQNLALARDFDLLDKVQAKSPELFSDKYFPGDFVNRIIFNYVENAAANAQAAQAAKGTTNPNAKGTWQWYIWDLDKAIANRAATKDVTKQKTLQALIDGDVAVLTKALQNSYLDPAAQLSVGLYLFAYNMNSLLGVFAGDSGDPGATVAERLNTQFSSEASAIIEYLFKAGVPFPAQLPASLKLEAWKREKGAFDSFTRITMPEKQTEFETNDEFAARSAEWKRLSDLVVSTELVVPAELALGTFNLEGGYFSLSISIPALETEAQSGNDQPSPVEVRDLQKADIRYYLDRKNAPFFKDKGFAAWTTTAVISASQPGVYGLKQIQVKNGKDSVTEGLWAFAVREVQDTAGETIIYVDNYNKGKEYDSSKTVFAYGVRILMAADETYSLSTTVGGPGQFDSPAIPETTPDFDWADIDGAKVYDFQLCTTKDFVTLVSEDAKLATSSFSQKTSLSFDSTYYWRVRAKNADGVWGAWSPTWSFTVSWPYTLTPTPADAETTTETTPLLAWNEVTGASGYEVQLANTSAGVAGSGAVATESSQYKLPATLALNDVRYWRVRAKNADGVWGAWSPTWSFTVSWPYTLTPTPADAGTTTETTPLLKWSAVTGASGYEVQLANTSVGVAGSGAAATESSLYKLPATLALNDVRYWRVRAKNADGVWGAWSPTWSFTVSWPYTLTPTPADAGTTTETTPLLKWSAVAGASGYEVQLANTSVGVAGSGAAATESSQYKLQATLAPNDVRYWRVRAKNADGVWGAWSQAWSFKIRPYVVGDVGPAGGIVFYDKGNYSDGWRYLEASLNDQSRGIQWSNGTNASTGPIETKVGSGKANTANIVLKQGAGNYAASLCAGLVQGGYNDWFLPSKDELDLMYKNLKKAGLGGFGSAWYWSSSESTTYPEQAWVQGFGSGTQNMGDYKRFSGYGVRAIRAF